MSTPFAFLSWVLEILWGRAKATTKNNKASAFREVCTVEGAGHREDGGVKPKIWSLTGGRDCFLTQNRKKRGIKIRRRKTQG
jgi:hypothetical protein